MLAATQKTERHAGREPECMELMPHVGRPQGHGHPALTRAILALALTGALLARLKFASCEFVPCAPSGLRLPWRL
jgi:hypothetical protein